MGGGRLGALFLRAGEVLPSTSVKKFVLHHEKSSVLYTEKKWRPLKLLCIYFFFPLSDRLDLSCTLGRKL